MLTKIGIVDSNILTTIGMKDTLEQKSYYKVEFISYTANQCLDKMKENNINILILDIVLPDMDGFEFLKKIRECGYKCKIIIFSYLNSDAFLYRAYRENVNAILCKDVSVDELYDSIHNINDNKFYIQKKYSESLRQCVLDSGNSNILSKRELEVLSCIANGLSNKEISQKLFISEPTVKSHVSNIILKLDVVDRTQAAVYAIKTGLIIEAIFS